MRDFTFAPDNGRITHLSYDTFGVPSIPEALLNVFEVRAPPRPSSCSPCFAHDSLPSLCDMHSVSRSPLGEPGRSVVPCYRPGTGAVCCALHT